MIYWLGVDFRGNLDIEHGHIDLHCFDSESKEDIYLRLFPSDIAALKKERTATISQHMQSAICPVQAMQCGNANVVVCCQSPDCKCVHRDKHQTSA